MTKKTAVIFISGGGSNMLALLEAARDPAYPVAFAAVISDKKDAGGLARADALGIRTAAFERRDFGSKAADGLESFEAFIKLADDELYRAKLEGRDRICYKQLT